MSINVAIVGYREFNDYKLAKEKIDKILEIVRSRIKKEIVIVSGGARGADAIAERYAKENSLKILVFYPNWSKYGKSAGPRRNKEIVDNSDLMIAFLHKNSIGTLNSIDLARSKGIPVSVYRIN